ncbi:hypothetical protein D3C85_1933500 [compost metagenome]
MEQVIVAGGSAWVVSFYQQDSLARQFWRTLFEQLPLRQELQPADPEQPDLLTYLLNLQAH